MKNLLRVFGLAIAIFLVSLTAVQAWPAYAPCSYSCSGGGFYSTWTTYGDCCSGNASALYCPPGETPSPGYSWGGGSSDYSEQMCW